MGKKTQEGKNVAFTGEYRNISIEKLNPSETNPRKHFEEKALQDLAASIREKGILEPLLVRHRPTEGPAKVDDYEIIAGERRYRAAKLAKQETLPCIIRELNDQQTIEVQIVENMHRADLSPLEEARGYKALHDNHGYDYDMLARKIGKSKTYIYSRLNLIKLPGKIQVAIDKGTLKTGWAEQLLRIPDEKGQVEVYEKILDDADNGWGITDIESLKDHIDSEYLLELKRAPFSTTATDLAPASVGACIICKNRTGADPDLFGEFSKRDCCQNKKCWDVKLAAHNEKLVAKFKSQGKEVLSGKEAEAKLKGIRYGSTYAKIDDMARNPVKGTKTWGEILKPLKKEVETVICIDSQGEVHQLVNTKSAIEALPKSMLMPTSPEDKPKTPEQLAKEKEEKKKAEQKQMAAEAAALETVNGIMDEAENIDLNSPVFLKVLLNLISDYGDLSEDLIELFPKHIKDLEKMRQISGEVRPWKPVKESECAAAKKALVLNFALYEMRYGNKGSYFTAHDAEVSPSLLAFLTPAEKKALETRIADNLKAMNGPADEDAGENKKKKKGGKAK